MQTCRMLMVRSDVASRISAGVVQGIVYYITYRIIHGVVSDLVWAVSAAAFAWAAFGERFCMVDFSSRFGGDFIRAVSGDLVGRPCIVTHQKSPTTSPTTSRL